MGRQLFQPGDKIKIKRDCSGLKKGEIHLLEWGNVDKGYLHILHAGGKCSCESNWQLITPVEKLQNLMTDRIGKPNHEIYMNIISWLYLNDGKYPDKNEWRKEFAEMLKKELLIS